jgi:hypothetical protein
VLEGAIDVASEAAAGIKEKVGEVLDKVGDLFKGKG